MENCQTDLKSPSSAPTRQPLVDSATLARLIEEVRNEPAGVERSYDRAHNRHNR